MSDDIKDKISIIDMYLGWKQTMVVVQMKSTTNNNENDGMIDID